MASEQAAFDEASTFMLLTTASNEVGFQSLSPGEWKSD
jgi:hypothetical protein